MCIAIPCQIVKFIDHERKHALGDFLGVKREINVQLLENLEIGDYVIVHVGFAIQKMDLKEAIRSIKSFKNVENVSMFSEF